MAILEYLTNKGIDFKKESGLYRCNCLFCEDDKKHMYVKDDGEPSDVYFCHKCGEKGNLWKLKKHYGDVSILQPLKKTYKKPRKLEVLEDKVINYLTQDRGFTKDTLDYFNVKSHKGWVAIPYLSDGEIVNYKYRNIEKKEWKRDKDCESILFNKDNIKKDFKIIVTESEFDCMSAHQMGFTNCVSSTTGAGSISDDAIDFFDGCIDMVFIAYDNDKAGDEGADKLAKRIGIHKCRRVKLPLKDFNDCMMAGFKDEVNKALEDATEYKLHNLIHANEVMERIEKLYKREDRGSGIQVFGSNYLNHALGGIRNSEITVLTGETASGKSTYCINLCRQLLEQDERVLVISTEMKAEKVLQKMFTVTQKKSFSDFTDEDLGQAMAHYCTKSLFFVDVHGKLGFDELREYILYAKRKYDVSFVFLDHLHFFLDMKIDNMTRAIESFVRDLVGLGLESDLPIWMVVHPAKLHNETGIVSLNDLKGSSATKQDCHNVISLWRDKKSEDKGRNIVIVDFQKVRDDSGYGGKVRYIFNPNTQEYIEC